MFSASQIVAENNLQGTRDWEIAGNLSANIEGYAKQFSVNLGEIIQFKIDTNANDYRLDIYRMGWYGGLGGRKVATVQPTNLQDQPDALFDLQTNTADASNWHVSASWAVPTNGVSGVYLAKLVREDGVFGENYIIFVVRDDNGQSDLLVQTSDTTWQAYNTWGGASLYSPNFPNGRGVAVSYNRPFVVRDQYPLNYFFGVEYAMVRFLERNGYDVSYTSGIDTDRRGSELLEHKVFVSVGHDEYWSGQQRANVEAARNAGVNLAFFGGNDVFWKTRWETDATGNDHGILVSYKETLANAKIDPEDDIWTGTWRDPRFSTTSDGGIPENNLTGTIFTVNEHPVNQTTSITGSGQYAALRFWRNTAVASLGMNQTLAIGDRVLGFEFNEDLDNGFRPAGLIPLSSTTKKVAAIIQDYGSTYAPGTATHSMTMYRATSGALVFSAGTIQYSWGLDDYHPVFAAATDRNLQQATVNLFADMGVQPISLMSGIVYATQSSDALKPVSFITSPIAGATLASGSTVTVRGTAQERGGGSLAVVEVSVDGGITWRRATGRENWTYTFETRGSGQFAILSRAVDDSGNIEVGGPRIEVNPVQFPGVYSLFTEDDTPSVNSVNDDESVELGLRFVSEVDAVVTGIRFYKSTGNTGTHKANLWTNTGQLIATATFTNETASGWQEVRFSTPVTILAGVTYIASYFAPNGNFSVDTNYFDTLGLSNGPLHALPQGPSGGNGVFKYANSSSFPDESYANSNYWVDVMIDTAVAQDNTAPTVESFAAADGSSTLTTDSAIVIKFSEAINAATINANTVQLLNPDPNSIPGGCCSTPGGWCTGCPLQMGANTRFINATFRYDAALHSVIVTPTEPLSTSQIYTVLVHGGSDGVKDLAGNAVFSDTAASFLTPAQPASVQSTMWPSTTSPANADSGDSRAVEAGVRFTADSNGFISGIRFYKSSANTGTHIANLWTASGQLLATATFTNETSSGWQQVNFSQPVAVTAGTTYVASYFAPNGHVSFDSNFFTSGFESGQLNVPANGGIYVYGANSRFPTSTYRSSNYWVDVVLRTAPSTDTTAPTVAAFTPSGGSSQVAVNGTATVRFSERIDAATITAATLKLLDSTNNMVPATLSYDSATMTVTITPTSQLAYYTTYTIAVTGGPFGIKDLAGNPLAQTVGSSFTTALPPVLDTSPPSVLSISPANDSIDVSPTGQITMTFSEAINAASVDANSVLLLKNSTTRITATVSYNAANRTVTITPSASLEYNTSYTVYIPGGSTGVLDLSGNALSSDFVSTFRTASAPAITTSLWSSTAKPGTLDSKDKQAVEVGVKFTANTNGYITAIRFYKSTANKGTHTGSLWSSTGQKLASVTFTNESASGWQTATFSTPVAITAGTTYVASYFAPLGRYSVNQNAFTSTFTSGPLTVAAGGGVYRYGTSSAFPSTTYRNSNYWVDVVFVADSTPPTVTSISPADSSTNVSTAAPITVTFSEALNAATVNSSTVRLLDGSSQVAATVSYNATNRTATLVPTAALLNSRTYTISVLGGASGITDALGDALAQTVTSTFTTAATTTTSSLWSAPTVPGNLDSGDNRAVEAGVVFTAQVDGYITGLRFYKSAANTGTHVANLWSSTGQLLATATFTNETASGWQQVNFSTPIALTAGTTYIASYFAPTGHVAFDNDFFTSTFTSGPLNVAVGGGVYRYGSSSVFPSTSYRNSNYWVDVVFVS